MVSSIHWTVRHLEGFPRDDGNRYEIIDGELHVTTQPSLEHQLVSRNCTTILTTWDRASGAGVTIPAPGVVFADDAAVAPDVVWIRRDRLAGILGPDRHLHDAPDLVIEILSPGSDNERRDREIKLQLYNRQGVREYWIVNWRLREVAVYRRGEHGSGLELVCTLHDNSTLSSPYLPGFSAQVADLFVDLPVNLP